MKKIYLLNSFQRNIEESRREARNYFLEEVSKDTTITLSKAMRGYL